MWVNISFTREIIFYQTESDDCPIEEFLDSLDAKQAQKVAWVMQVVEELDKVPTTYLKVLTNSFQKKTQKTPKSEILLSEERKKDYLERK